MTSCRVRHGLLALLLLLLPACHAADPAPAANDRWWKGNLHTHSLWSDGNDFPEVIARWYRDQGYHFLALSDHNVLPDGERWMKIDDVVRRGAREGVARYRAQFGDDVVVRERDGKQEVRLRPLHEYRGRLEEPGRFLLLPGEEVSASFDKLPIHQNATNPMALIRPQPGGSVRDTMAANLRAILAQAERQDEPLLAHLNHPNFYFAITAEDVAEVVAERFFEVWNGHPSVHHLGDEQHASIERLWDIANTLRLAQLGREPLYGLGTDDSHHYFAVGPQLSVSGRGWVMVRAAALTPAALLGAMQRGDFYASSGVTLRDVSFGDGVLRVEVAAEPGERYAIRFMGTRRGCDLRCQPVRDAAGKVVRATFRYGDEVGAVLQTSDGPVAEYRLTGDELYVRAVVTSTATVERPLWDGQPKQAWTQPVGWSLPQRSAGAAPSTIAPPPGLADPRGVASDRRGRFFWSGRGRLLATDAAGTVLASTAVPQAGGALAFWNEAVFLLAGDRVLQFEPATLRLVAEHPLAAPASALAVVGGTFYLFDADAEGLVVRRCDDRFAVQAEHRLPDLPAVRPHGACFAEGRFWLLVAGADPGSVELRTTDLDLTAVQRWPAPVPAFGLCPGTDGVVWLAGPEGLVACRPLATGGLQD